MGSLRENDRPLTCGRMDGRCLDSRATIGVMALLSVPQASAAYGLSRTHIRRLMAAGVLKGQKVGNSWGVNEASVKVYLAAEHRPGPKPKKGNTKKKSIDKHGH